MTQIFDFKAISGVYALYSWNPIRFGACQKQVSYCMFTISIITWLQIMGQLYITKSVNYTQSQSLDRFSHYRLALCIISCSAHYQITFHTYQFAWHFLLVGTRLEKSNKHTHKQNLTVLGWRCCWLVSSLLVIHVSIISHIKLPTYHPLHGWKVTHIQMQFVMHHPHAGCKITQPTPTNSCHLPSPHITIAHTASRTYCILFVINFASQEVINF